jgi:hypothetical protein
MDGFGRRRRALPALIRLERDLGLAVDSLEQLEELCGSLTIRRESSSVSRLSSTATWERLRCRSMPTEFIRRPPPIQDFVLPER